MDFCVFRDVFRPFSIDTKPIYFNNCLYLFKKKNDHDRFESFSQMTHISCNLGLISLESGAQNCT